MIRWPVSLFITICYMYACAAVIFQGKYIIRRPRALSVRMEIRLSLSLRSLLHIRMYNTHLSRPSEYYNRAAYETAEK